VVAHDHHRPLRPAVADAVDFDGCRCASRCGFVHMRHPGISRRLGSTPSPRCLCTRHATAYPAAPPDGVEAIQQPSTDTTIAPYWQPGCTSCLRMREFLARHGVPFISRNVLEDEEGVAELAALGLRTVPIVRRGTDWANGQVLRDVARVAGIPWGGATMLPVP